MSVSSPATTRIHRRHGSAVTSADPSPAANSIDLTTIQQRLLATVSTAIDAQQAGTGLADLALQLTNADRVVYFATSMSSEPLLISASRVDPPPAAFTQQQLIDLSINAIQQRKLQVSRNESAALISVPVFLDSQTDAITASLALHGGAVEPFVVSLQMVAAHATLWWQQQEKRRLDWEADMAAGIVEIVADIERSNGFSEASIVMANRIHQLLGAQHVAVGWREMRSGYLTLQSVSERAEIDRNGESGRLWESAMNEAMIGDGIAIWPPTSPEDRAALLAHRKLAQKHQVAASLTFPLLGTEDSVVGAVTVLLNDPDNGERTASFGKTASPFLASALQTARRLEGGRVRRILNRTGSFTKSKSRSIIAACVVLISVTLFPVPHRIDCDCETQAAARRYSVAPYAGILKETLVKPGDVVNADQILATMDDREINWELSSLIADRDRAAKEYDIALAKNETAKMQMSRLEVQRNDLQIQLLEHRKESLDIRASVSGVVLRGDLEDVQDAPVETGQALFEIAPLDQLRIEIRVPEDEISYVNIGMSVETYLDALPGETMQGTVTRIYPQAEVVDSQNVFVAEVELAEVPEQLRPGMQGGANVCSQKRALGWIYFHRPWQRLVNFLR